MKRKENTSTYDDLLKLAKEYHVDNNALFLNAARQYQTQALVIEMMKNQLEADGSAVSTKEYVKGRENVYANPIIKELPKHADSASRTLSTMLEIIKKLGYKQEKETALGLFDKEFE